MKKIVAMFTLLAVLTACGGGGRPSEDEIADALKDNNSFGDLTNGASDEIIDCIAKALHESDLSDDALRALVDGDEDFTGDKDDTEAIADIQDDLTKCITLRPDRTSSARAGSLVVTSHARPGRSQ